MRSLDLPFTATLTLAAALFVASDAFGQTTTPTPTSPAAAPTTSPAQHPQPTAVAIDEQPFDPAEHLTGDWFGRRKWLFDHGVDFQPSLVVDWSKNFRGGLNTHADSWREWYNIAVQIDTEKLLGLHGGTAYAAYQIQHGGNASRTLTGDAQNFAYFTNADGRTQLGQLWYQQKFADDTLRLRLGKLDANADFDVLDNATELLNNSFQTTPTLALLPSYPDNATGVQLFYEPKGSDDGSFYAGAGVFDGSGARGVKTGENGPKHFFDRPNDLFFIAEAGLHYKLRAGDRQFPGKVGVGAWYDSNPFEKLNGNGKQDGTGGAYLILDQVLYKPYRQKPVAAGAEGTTTDARPQAEEFPGGIAASLSLGWAESTVNRIDANALVSATWTGAIPARPIDVGGVGATYAHFPEALRTRESYELAVEAFYRVRFTRFVSLKPDLQYIFHPSGGGEAGGPARGDALVFTLRLEMTS